MADTTYNGWTNYETWLVNLWLANDEGYYGAARAVAAESDAVQELRALVDEIVANEAGPSGLAADLIGAALSSVDWSEIVDGMRE